MRVHLQPASNLCRSTAKQASELHRQPPHCCKLGGPRFQRVDADGLSGGNLAAGFNAKRRRGERRDHTAGHRIQRSYPDRSRCFLLSAIEGGLAVGEGERKRLDDLKDPV